MGFVGAVNLAYDLRQNHLSKFSAATRSYSPQERVVSDLRRVP